MIVIGSNTSDNGQPRFTEDISHFVELRQNRQLALLKRSAKKRKASKPSIYKNKKISENKDTSVLNNKWVKWCEKSEQAVSFKYFRKCITTIRIVTNVPKLHSFQYRLMLNALVLNTHLYAWGMRSNNLCTFCNLCKESLQHLFVNCTVITQLWQDILCDISDCHPCRFITTRLVNQQNCRSNPSHIYNLICLITKQYIYRQRCFNAMPNAQQLINEIRKIQFIEKI